MRKGLKRFIAAALLVWLALGAAAAEETLGENEYLGENAYGVGGAIRVKVTMDGDVIAAIKTLEQHETRELGGFAIMQLTEEMIKGNTVEVDSVSGATLSCIAFKAAVRQAVEDATDFDPTAGVELSEGEYLGLSDNALGGRLMVKVAVKEGVIAAIDVLESHESPEIGEVALQTLIPQMVEGNTSAVDAISGATVTSKALGEAVAQAVEASQQ